MAERTPVKVWIAPGANVAADPSTWSWSDVTDRVRKSQPITVEVGRRDEWEDVDPTKAKILFDDTAGDFSELNPSGQWYGLLGPDTPVRVAVRRLDDDFGRTESGWGTAPSGQAWGNGSGGAVNGGVGSGVATHTMPAAGDTRFAIADVSLRNVDFSFRVSTLDTIAGASMTTTAIARWADSSNFVSGRATINPGGLVDLSLGYVAGGVGGALEAATSIPGVAYTAGALLWVRLCVRDSWAGLAVFEDGDVPPGWQLETSELPVLAAGGVGMRTVRTVGNTNPDLTARYHDAYADVDRIGGYASNWAPRTSHRDVDRTVAVTVTGELGRLSPAQATLPVESPMRRAISSDPDTVAYWPAEEGSTAGSIASALPGHAAATFSGTVAFTDVEALDQFVSYVAPVTAPNFRYGTPSLANLEAGGRLDAVLPPAATAATVAAQSLYLLARLDDSVASANVVLLEWDTPGGTFARWQFVYVLSPINMILRAWTSGGVSTDVVTAGSGFAGLLDVSISLRQNGGNIDCGMFSNGLGGHVFTGSVAGTLAGVQHVAVNAARATYSDDLFPAGHLAVRGAYGVPGFVDDQFDDYGAGSSGARLAYRNEAAHLRLARLLAEDGIRLVTTPIDAGDAVFVQRMFSQDSATAPDLYRAAAAADGGILMEAPWAVAYRPRRALYAQPVALELEFAGDLTEPPVPELGQSTYRNSITVERTEGSSYTAQAAEVAAGDALPRREKLELELASDSQVEPHADWRLSRRSLRAPRWPELDINLGARPALIDAWLSADVGSRVLVTGLPTFAGARDVEAMLEGWTEVLGAVRPTWRATLALSPGEVFADVGIYDATATRADSASSSLTSDVASGATALSVTTTDVGDLWITGAVSFEIMIGGEVMLVTNIASATSPQTFTVARAQNGVVKAHAAGAPVRLADPVRYAL